jgi:DNA-binding LacI/PurR family transcriptional regulator
LLVRSIGKGTFVNRNIEPNPPKHSRIGIVMQGGTNSLSSPFLSHLLEGIKSILSKNNHSMTIYDESENSLYFDLDNDNLQGLIILASQLDENKISLMKKVPFVLLGRPVNKDVCPYYVTNDNVESMKILTTHLINNGYSKIALINGPSNYTVCQDKLSGYKKAIETRGLKIDPRFICNGEYSEANGYANTEKLIKYDIEAIIAADEFITIGVLQCLKENKLKIPDDLALAGFHNSPFLSHINPPITTVDVFPMELGCQTARKLEKLIKNEPVKKGTHVKIELLIRESTAPITLKTAH